MLYFWVYLPNASSDTPTPLQARIERPQTIQATNSTFLPERPIREIRASGYERLLLTREDLTEAGGYDRSLNTWSQEQDRLLLLYRDKKQMQWDAIADKLPGRTGHTCYNRYKRIVHRTRALWREKDDQKLLRLVEEHGKNWSQIGKHLTSNPPDIQSGSPSIEEHYLNHLRPGLSQDAWTLQDDLQLVEVLNEHDFDWAAAHRTFPERSLNQIKNRFKSRLRRLNELKITELEKAVQRSS